MSQFYDQASLVMVPSGYKAGKVYSQKPLTTDGQLTFTRASTATRVNASGLIESVASEVPRLDYSGGASCCSLLLEPQRTNNITFSENQGPIGTNWYPSNTWTVTNNTVTSPSGYQDADTLTETATYGFHSSYFNAVIANAYTGTYTISAFAKYNGRLFVLSPKGDTERTYFNLQTGTVAQLGGGGVTAKIEDYGSGWYRCSVTCSFSSENVNFEHLLASAAGTLQYTGDGTSGVHIWGCMAEAGAYATSYIPTLSSAVTRVADAAYKTGISSLIGQTEGTIYWETQVDTPTATGHETFLNVDAGSFNDTIYMFKTAGGLFIAEVYDNGVLQATFSKSGVTAGVHKLAIGYANNNTAFFVDGAQVGSTDTSCTIPTMSRIQLGQNVFGPSTDKTAQLLVFPTRLSNADLATLTA